MVQRILYDPSLSKECMTKRTLVQNQLLSLLVALEMEQFMPLCSFGGLAGTFYCLSEE